MSIRLKNTSNEQVQCLACQRVVPAGSDAECSWYKDPANCDLRGMMVVERPTRPVRVRTGAQLLEELAEPAPFRPEEIIARPDPRHEIKVEPYTRVVVPEGYGDLFEILMNAFTQSSAGKGRERHNRTGTLPFNKQPIMEIGRMVGPGYASGQAMKKLQEALRLPKDRAIAECYGAIVYAAAMVLLLREQEQDK